MWQFFTHTKSPVQVARAAEYGEHWEQDISAENEPARKSECKNRFVRNVELS